MDKIIECIPEMKEELLAYMKSLDYKENQEFIRKEIEESLRKKGKIICGQEYAKY